MPHIKFKDRKIYYRLQGKGRIILLLHGFGENGTIWDQQASVLSKDYCIIVPDLPGSGLSEAMEKTLLLRDHADLIKAIVDQLWQDRPEKRAPFSLIGHSMGGYIALAFAEKYPSLLNSFGLFHSSAFADNDSKIATRRKGIQFIRENGSEAFLKLSAPNLFSENSRKNRPEMISKLINLGKNISPEVLIQYYEAMILRPDRIPVLTSFPRPILFIMGKTDTAVPLETSLAQCHLPSIATVRILSHSGHMGMWEEPHLSTRFLKEFLNNT